MRSGQDAINYVREKRDYLELFRRPCFTQNRQPDGHRFSGGG